MRREEARALKGIKYYARLGLGLLQAAIDQAADPGVRPDRFAGRPATWILEKFWAWTDCDGHPENILGRDELLDNVMLYWVTETAASSARIYWESFGPERRTIHKVGVPTEVAAFPTRDRDAGAALDGRQLHQHPALERDAQRAAISPPSSSPGCSSSDVRAFFRKLR